MRSANIIRTISITGVDFALYRSSY